MRTDNIISVKQIKNREQCLKSSNESSDASYMYNVAVDSIQTKKFSVRRDVEAFFNECANKKNANAYYNNCLNILEMITDDKYLYNRLEVLFCSRIMPYIENISVVKDTASSKKLNEDTIEYINETAKVYRICDRIINNNEKLSTRFNFDKFIRENAYRPFDEVILKCCEMIDTYDTPAYAKMNIAIEEFSYILQKNLIDYDASEMVKIITEYFINFGNNNEESVNEFRRTLSENYCISEDDLSKVKFFMEDFIQPEEANNNDFNPYEMGNNTVNINNINTCIMNFNQFRAKVDKSIDDFRFVLEKNANEMVAYQIQSLSDIFDWVRNYGLNKFKDSTLINDISIYLNNLIELINGNTNQLDSLETILNIESNKLNSISDNDIESKASIDIFYQVLSDIKDKIDVIKCTSITESEKLFKDLAAKAVKAMSNKDFKIFKFDNLIKYAWNANKKIKAKEKSLNLGGKIKGKIVDIFNSAKNWLKEDFDLGDSSNIDILDSISESGNFDHILTIFESTSLEDVAIIRSELDSLCNELNEDATDKDFKVYYTNIDNIFEIHLADTTYITLTEEEIDIWNKTFTEAEQAYAGYLIDLCERFETYDNLNTSTLAEDFSKIENTLSSDAIVGIIEASKYLLDMIPYARLQEIAETYADNNPIDYMGNTAISQALDSWKLEECDFDTIVDTVAILRECVDEALLTEADSKAKQAVDNAKENIKKIEKTKINFNSLRYAMESLRGKANSAGDKAKQFSQTLNVYVEKFISSVQKLYTNDNREQIIKGSIIPSFHQLMGRLLVIGGAAGIGAFVAGSTAAIFTAAVTTFATIAISKHSTDKERALMLDEIEIELDICDKEMNRAEANGQMKKYRALMYRKAKLKREYQRIRYNIGYSEYKHNPVIHGKGNE